MTIKKPLPETKNSDEKPPVDPNTQTPANALPPGTSSEEDAAIEKEWEELGTGPVDREAYRKVNKEARNHRLKYNAARDELDTTKAELAALKAAKKAEEDKRLADNQEFERLYKQEQEDKKKIVANLEARAVDLSLEKKMIAAGLDLNLIPLIDKTGILVDTETGLVKGVDQALDAFKAKHAEMIATLERGKAAGLGTQTPAAQAADPTNNPADNMLVPGTSHTYADMKKILNLANGGATPPQGTPPAKPAEVDISKMTKAEADAWYANYKKTLANK